MDNTFVLVFEPGKAAVENSYPNLTSHRIDHLRQGYRPGAIQGG
jgi:hypothetical protein